MAVSKNETRAKRMQTERLIVGFLEYMETRISPPTSKDGILCTMIRLADEVEFRYSERLNDLCSAWDLKGGKQKADFDQVLDALFDDGCCNWGRIIVAFLFASRIHHHMQQQKEPPCQIVPVHHWFEEYIASKLIDWIEKNGGWVSASMHHFSINKSKKKDNFFRLA